MGGTASSWGMLGQKCPGGRETASLEETRGQHRRPSGMSKSLGLGTMPTELSSSGNPSLSNSPGFP